MLAHFAYMALSVREIGQGRAVLGVLFFNLYNNYFLVVEHCYHKDFKNAIPS